MESIFSQYYLVINFQIFMVRTSKDGKSDKSIILISHRLSAVHISDEIWFVKDGEIIGIGTHKQLIDSCSEYREMYEADKAKYTKILV